ncbi:MAG: DNA phosphorothioation-associated protein 4 [Cyanobacteria bacterium P01_A01_bin.123]
MALARIHFSEDKAEFVRSLKASDFENGPFQTYADIVIFSAALGYNYRKRVLLGNYSRKDPDAVLQEQLRNPFIIQLIAIAETRDPKILSDQKENEIQRIELFEEYVNGGLEILSNELNGVVDYTEKILLMLKLAKQSNVQSQDFDLSKFL